MRKYALVILDKFDKIIDRYNLDVVTNPTGNGFKLALSTISSDIEDIITKVVQEKLVIKFIVNHIENSYQKATMLAHWIQKYSTAPYQMALEYDDGVTIKYCEGRVTDLGKTEKDEFNNLEQELEFTQTTPFFLRRENTITFQVSSKGKRYPYTYPYSYGASVVENNEINNIYLLDIPLILTIEGAIDRPTIDLLDEYGNRYSRVQFEDVSIAKGEQLIINSAQRKIYKISKDGQETDYIPEVNPMYDTFLRAASGKSTISMNTVDSGEGFKMTGGWREYSL